MVRIRIFRVMIFASGDEAPMKTTGVENFILAEGLSANRFAELVILGVRKHGIKIIQILTFFLLLLTVGLIQTKIFTLSPGRRIYSYFSS